MADAELNWKIYTKDHHYETSNIGTEADRSWQDDFFFVQGADPQFGLMDFFRPGYTPETANWDEEIRLAKLAVKKVNKLNPKPRFFVICGDLTNQMPDESDTLGLKQKQIADFKKIFSEIDKSIPLVCVCGNHDVGNFPTIESVQKYRSTYGDDYFSFWCGGVLFIVLNSQYYTGRNNVVKLAEEQDQWLDKQLNAAKGSRIVCFSHIPWFFRHVDESDNIFNIPLEWRTKMLDKLYNAGVRHIFCGHLHRNAGGFYKDLEVVVTSAIGMQMGVVDKSGVRIVNVTKDKITHEYRKLNNIPMNLCCSQ